MENTTREEIEAAYAVNRAREEAQMRLRTLLQLIRQREEEDARKLDLTTWKWADTDANVAALLAADKREKDERRPDTPEGRAVASAFAMPATNLGPAAAWINE